MGIPIEEYDEWKHAYCGRCGVAMLMEHMECPVEGDGLYCPICSEQIRSERMSRVESYRLICNRSMKQDVLWFKRDGMSLSDLIAKVTEFYTSE